MKSDEGKDIDRRDAEAQLQKGSVQPFLGGDQQLDSELGDITWGPVWKEFLKKYGVDIYAYLDRQEEVRPIRWFGIPPSAFWQDSSQPLYPEYITYSLENYGKFVDSNVKLCSNVLRKKGMRKLGRYVDELLGPMLQVDWRKRMS